MAEFTLDLQYVVEEVAECLSRNSVLVPVLSLPRSIQVASVNVPFRWLAAPGASDGSVRVSTIVVTSAKTQGPVRWQELAQDQLMCQETQDVTLLQLEKVGYLGVDLWFNTSTGLLQPLVPAYHQQREIFNQAHKLSHPGRRATKQLVQLVFLAWPGC